MFSNVHFKPRKKLKARVNSFLPSNDVNVIVHVLNQNNNFTNVFSRSV